MTEQSLITTTNADIIESVVIQGDLSKLTAEQRVKYYQAVCQSVGLNPLTRPFDYITLSGKLVLYAKKDATEQLRKLNGVSITKLERDKIDSVYVVTAYAADSTGRQDSSTGVVSIENLRGDALANAFMKAETKAKRRVTLSICGLGLLDETELETIPNVRPETFDNYQRNPPINQYPEEQSAPVSMSLETAMAVKNSKDVPYGDLDSETLSHMTAGIGRGLLKAGISDAERDEYQFKRDAIKVILASRNDR